MPRSRLNNWASRQRLAYIDYHLDTHGWINRQALMDYFAIEQSLGSMDLTAYREAGGKLRQAIAGETLPDGTVHVGRKLGGRAIYVKADDWEPVTTGIGRRWDLLPAAFGCDHAGWMRGVVSAYVADCGRDDYFGFAISGVDEVPACDLRRGIWESFR